MFQGGGRDKVVNGVSSPVIIVWWLQLTSFFSVMSKLIFDLRMTLEPHFDRIYSTLLDLSGKTLSAEVFTLVLEALSTLLRYIPPTSTESLRSLYFSFLDTFRKCSYEVQRAGGEVWGTVLRRLKGSNREVGVHAILERLEEADGVLEAWAAVSACKVCLLHIEYKFLDGQNDFIGCLPIVT